MPAPSRARLEKACDALGRADPALAQAVVITGVPKWRDRPATYETLAGIITGQQISTLAAAAIWARTQTALGEVTPRVVLDRPPEALTACGQSRPKVSHLRSIAEAVEAGALDFDRLAASDLDAARDELLAVKGIGPWTADLFLMSALGALDAFPAGDVALMEALRLLESQEKRMESKAFTARAEAWRPYRGVAAHVLWAYIHHAREKATPTG